MDEQTKRDIEIAVKILQQAGATDVFIFGSVAHGKMRQDSDLDVAVRGLPSPKFFAAMSAVTFAISRSFDLIDLDDENPFTQYLEKEGELLRVA